MDTCFLDVLRRQPKVQFEARMDSAFFSEQIVAINRKRGVEFSATVAFQRYPLLKQIIKQQQRWSRIDRIYSAFEIEWKPKSWSQDAVRLLLVRQRRKVQQKGPLQLDLFEPVDVTYENTRRLPRTRPGR